MRINIPTEKLRCLIERSYLSRKENDAMLILDMVIDDILLNKTHNINAIKDKNEVDISCESENENIINLSLLIQNIISSFLAEHIDWWVGTLINQYRIVATKETKRIVENMLGIYTKNNGKISDSEIKSIIEDTEFKNNTVKIKG